MYEKAKAIVVERPKQAVVKEIPLAPVDEQTIVVRTVYSAISTGTEMKVWSGLSGHLGGELWYPLIPGYEEVGEVMHVGKQAKGVKVGDRVMANEVRHYPAQCAAWGGQCGLAIKNAVTSPSPFDPVAKIPDNVSYQEAVVAYLAAVSEKGVQKAKPRAGETVLVIGQGLIGLSWVQLAKLAGCRVIAMDQHAGRLALAAKYADATINSRLEDPLMALGQLTHGRRADLVVECSGNPAMFGEVCRYLRDGGWDRGDEGGRIHLQADYPGALLIQSYQTWFTKNPTLTMTCAIRPGGKEEILRLMSEGKFDAKGMLADQMTLEMPVDQAPEAYNLIHRSAGDILKVLLKW